MILALIAINTGGWLVLQLAIAWAATQISSRRFAADNRLYKVRPWEIGFYRRRLHIRRWKHRLPDGAPWIGGSFRKKTMQARNSQYLQRWLIETRRGELAHWLMLACFPIFFLWNPPWARIVMALYAIAANLPCIFVQRYNRAVLQGLLSHRGSQPILTHRTTTLRPPPAA